MVKTKHLSPLEGAIKEDLTLKNLAKVLQNLSKRAVTKISSPDFGSGPPPSKTNWRTIGMLMWLRIRKGESPEQVVAFGALGVVERRVAQRNSRQELMRMQINLVRH